MDNDRQTDQIERWIGHAVEHYEEDAWDAVDAALAIADTFQKLYMLQLRALEIDMMRQRHQLEVVKRAQAMAALEKMTKRESVNEPW